MAIDPKTNVFRGLASGAPTGRPVDAFKVGSENVILHAPDPSLSSPKSQAAVASIHDRIKARRLTENTFSFGKGPQPTDAETYNSALAFRGKLPAHSRFALETAPTKTSEPKTGVAAVETTTLGVRVGDVVPNSEGLSVGELLTSSSAILRLKSTFLGAANSPDEVVAALQKLAALEPAPGQKLPDMDEMARQAAGLTLAALKPMENASPMALAEMALRQLKRLEHVKKVTPNNVELNTEMLLASLTRILLNKTSDLPPEMYLL